MGEQEQYKKILKKIIKETESFKIQSSEELIQSLVHELGQFNKMVNKSNNIQTNSVSK
ncbi:hypothetical protein [Virgibacillus alimentarius]|uniref:Aspartyl-phosphate phosphatase Spo0E family protein n=1 Tax=Virgibacillus alimentarius TaxID=698769 RepID=A0ABS4S5N7_9BACI|nr:MULTISPECIES: hypothetical protein [Virgibacillus]MBP2256778.1 hypothetical protein [Virgibacillus alimentarius]HLR65647.1 hypothetical protein [Virgibacillus sp.]